MIEWKDEIQNANWIKQFSGHWSILSCHYFTEAYALANLHRFGVNIPRFLCMVKQGNATGYIDKNDLDYFGQALSHRIEHNPHESEEWSKELRQHTDQLNSFFSQFETKKITPADYFELWTRAYPFIALNSAIKRTQDYLPQPLSEKILPFFSETRKYSQTIYTNIEFFLEKWAQQESKPSHYPAELLLCMSKFEAEEYLHHHALPQLPLLKERAKACAVLYTKHEHTAIEYPELWEVEKKLAPPHLEESFSGQIAQPGKVTGNAKISLDPHAKNDFSTGDILVTQMTRPEYMHFIRKASAIVTDAGGRLCHAAIVARELGIPAIVGTEHATSTLKTGDRIEVDADAGIIRRLSVDRTKKN